jgi:HSP20 family protein
MGKEEAAERMIGRAVIEASKRSRQAREMIRRVIGDVMDDAYFGASEGYDIPAVDLIDMPEEVVAIISLPGAKKEEIDLSVAEDALSIKADLASREGKYLRRERSSLGMKREIKLPVEIKPEQVQAKFENGILEVHLPKLIVIMPHRVDIE